MTSLASPGPHKKTLPSGGLIDGRGPGVASEVVLLGKPEGAFPGEACPSSGSPSGAVSPLSSKGQQGPAPLTCSGGEPRTPPAVPCPGVSVSETGTVPPGPPLFFGFVVDESGLRAW